MKHIATFFLIAPSAIASARGATKPVRVFILTGQSNMEGHGFVAADPKRNGGKGSLEFVGQAMKRLLGAK